MASERADYTSRILRGSSDVGIAYKDTRFADNIIQVLVKPEDSTPAALTALSGTVDMFFIDGDHTYEGVKADTLAALELASPDATIVWHDFYDFPDYLAQGSRRGVFPWLNEFAAQSDYKLFHIVGTYLVVARRAWPAIEARLRQPGDQDTPFRSRIVRLGEA